MTVRNVPIDSLGSVALLAESVDRNDVSLNYKEVLLCRSPCGERG